MPEWHKGAQEEGDHLLFHYESAAALIYCLVPWHLIMSPRFIPYSTDSHGFDDLASSQECLNWLPFLAHLFSKDSRGQELGEGIYTAARHGSLSNIPSLKNSSWRFKATAAIELLLQFAFFRTSTGKAG